VIVHEAVGVADPVVSIIDVIQSVQKKLSVPGLSEDGLLFVAPRCDVIDGVGVFYAQWSCHGCSLSWLHEQCQD